MVDVGEEGVLPGNMAVGEEDVRGCIDRLGWGKELVEGDGAWGGGVGDTVPRDMRLSFFL